MQKNIRLVIEIIIETEKIFHMAFWKISKELLSPEAVVTITNIAAACSPHCVGCCNNKLTHGHHLQNTEL